MQELQQLLLQVCGLAFDSVERAGEDSAALCVRKAEAYIREHYSDETLSLNTIKEEFAISVSYFSAIFKAHTGSTFVEYLTQLRIEKAKQLLTDAGYPDGFEMDITVPSNYQPHVDTAEVIAQQLKAIGVSVNINFEC